MATLSAGIPDYYDPSHTIMSSSHESDKLGKQDEVDLRVVSIDVATFRGNADHLQRRLGNRQVQLSTIGAAIGTAVFILIGSALESAGPLGLLLSYTTHCGVILLVNTTLAEMVTFMPISGSYLRMAGKWVDDAFGFMAGWNFFLYQCSVIPFEISALSIVLTFWRNDIPVAAVCAACCTAYFLINAFTVKYYGESEFWLAIGKVILIFIVFSFTLVTMAGGNPQHDAYGFRYWRNPGPFAESFTTGSLGRFEGFLQSWWIAVFTMAGPEYVALLAGEAVRPRKVIKAAFKTIYLRLGLFFIGSAICVGIVLPYNDPTLLQGGLAGAAGSPYVIAMKNLGINGLPHVVNALLLTSIFSAGNAYVYAGTRSLYSLSLEGYAPAFLQKCTKSGNPIFCLAVTMIFALLSFLQVSQGTAAVITWLVNLTTASIIINYMVVCITYLCFYRALKAQNFDRSTLPYRGWGQPYLAWIALVTLFVIFCTYSYTIYLPGNWSIGDFFSYYTMGFLSLLFLGGWKILRKTKMVTTTEVDLVWDRPIIDAYEETAPPVKGFWREIADMFGYGKLKSRSVEEK